MDRQGRQDVFGEVRALLAENRPSAWRWRFICALLDEAGDDVWLTEQVIPYVERALVGWPDALRVAPLDWLRRAGAGEAMPALRLARTLRDVPELEVYQRIRDAAWIGALPQLSQITTLHVRPDAGIGRIEGLLEGLPAVRALTCHGGDMQGPATRHPLAWRKLRSLRLLGGSAHNYTKVLEALGSSGASETLRALGLSTSQWASIPASLLSQQWGALEALMLGKLTDAWPLASLSNGAPRLRALELILAREGGEVSWWRALMESRAASQLDALALTDAHLPPTLVDRLPALHTLSLTTCQAERAIEPSPGRLRGLALRNVPYAICRALWHDPALERLHTSACDATPEDLRGWLALPRLAELDALEWQACPLDQITARQITAPLVSCTLQSVRPSEAGMRALASAACSATLRALQLNRADLSARRLRPLCEASMPALEHLSLGGNHLGASGLAAIMDAPWFGQLRTLCLFDNGLPAEAFELWGIAPRSRIERLDWSSCAVAPDAEGAQAFFDSPALRELRILDLGNKVVSEPLAHAVVAALPRLWAVQLHPWAFSLDESPVNTQCFAGPRLEVCALRHLGAGWRPDLAIEALRGTPWFDIALCTPSGGGAPEALEPDQIVRSLVSLHALKQGLVSRSGSLGDPQLPWLDDMRDWAW